MYVVAVLVSVVPPEQPAQAQAGQLHPHLAQLVCGGDPELGTPDQNLIHPPPQYVSYRNVFGESEVSAPWPCTRSMHATYCKPLLHAQPPTYIFL